MFPFCHISTKQLLIKCYVKCYKPPPDFASQTTSVQITLFLHTISKINYAFVYYSNGSVQSTILILFMIAMYDMNAYGLNSVVFSAVHKCYILNYSI